MKFLIGLVFVLLVCAICYFAIPGLQEAIKSLFEKAPVENTEIMLKNTLTTITRIGGI